MTSAAIRIRIRGLVQGVGFRPFVYRIAGRYGVKGWVENNNEGVSIHAEAAKAVLDCFVEALQSEAPLASSISFLEQEACEFCSFESFNIRNSSVLSNAVTEVSPDIAVCADCLEDMKEQQHRIAYPFVNCTNCGPRFTIIRELPYDRAQTTMDVFRMCNRCQDEYTDLYDRRFHAQPVACLHCGPGYFLFSTDALWQPLPNAAQAVAGWINQGKIVAIKGMGGFHLLCDASSEEAVKELRKRKSRESKPMAVMVSPRFSLEQHFLIDEHEKQLLHAWQRPIVLLRHRLGFAPSVSNGMHTTGIVLPYMPIHYQLFDYLNTEAIVLTSGNISDEPIIIDDHTAGQQLGLIADVVVGYNRKIHNRADDSVMMVAAGRSRMLRRSRGFVPQPVQLGLPLEGIFAAGAELVNTFAIGKGSQAIVSQHIGDLKNAETLAFYEESFQRFCQLFRFKPELVACDMHPDYLSSQFARGLGLECVEIQHHHAHIASCMAEHGLDEKVIGIALDGTGFGDDGTIWGGEFLLCDLATYERAYFFDPVALPGGDKAVNEPWRIAVSYLWKYFGEQMFQMKIPLFQSIDKEQLELVVRMLQLGLNCPQSSGAGRLFDAVAALLTICTHARFHAEAPMLLEAAMREEGRGKYLYDIDGQRIVFMKLFYLIVKDINNSLAVSVISEKFHNTMVAMILTVARRLKNESGIHKVVLSGGSFQNRYLLSKASELLHDAGFEVYSQQKVPTNDGGIALGQLAIAAKRRQLGII